MRGNGAPIPKSVTLFRMTTYEHKNAAPKGGILRLLLQIFPDGQNEIPAVEDGHILHGGDEG